MNIHNYYRESHGVSPLSLDENLNTGAENYARVLASKGVLQHSNGQGQYGENLSVMCGGWKFGYIKNW